MMLSIIIIGSSYVNGKGDQLDGGPDVVILTINGSRDWDDLYGRYYNKYSNGESTCLI